MSAILKKKGPTRSAIRSSHVHKVQANGTKMNAHTHSTAARPAPIRHVTIPAIVISAGDLLDGSLDQLRTCHAALNPDNKGTLDDEVLFSIWSALRHAMNDLDALRDHLNDGVNS